MRPADSVVSPAVALKCELAAEALRGFGTLRFPAIGSSMLPTVWPGDTLVVERVSGDGVRVGDVVVVGRQGKLCAHRVIDAARDSGRPQWITQGDALPLPDSPVSESELLGRVTYLIRNGKLVAVPSKLSGMSNVVAKLVRSSVFAARGLIYLNRLRQTSGRSVLPCEG
jgi:signal peptidase I